MKEQYQIAVELLQKLIQTQSFSSEEHNTAAIIEDWLEDHGVSFNRTQNNIWAVNKYFDENKPTILLNSHHDTVRPNKGYTNDPYDAFIEGDKLFGLGSNDAGGCLVSLLSTFVHFYEQKNMKYNLAVAATAEEESSGPNGLNSILEILPEIDFAIVGEPTEMHLAIAEKGLLVIDAYAKGIPGHAAHENTVNAITNAIKDIEWINNYKFSKVSDQLGKVKMSVTQIKAGELHNLVPAECHFVIDIRVNEAYSNREVFEIISENTQSELKPRSFKLNSSSIDKGHPLVLAGIDMGRKTYGSPTLSDQSVLSCNSVKLGPGVSLRSHSANEYILVSEIEEGIRLYKELLSKIL
ncbi:MAG: M20 family metallo-hydrolase [Flavobacteriales bacterium]|nr:M20 family metallo-hydrolase [Flavobacteriales bacterium]